MATLELSCRILRDTFIEIIHEYQCTEIWICVCFQGGESFNWVIFMLFVLFALVFQHLHNILYYLWLELKDILNNYLVIHHIFQLQNKLPLSLQDESLILLWWCHVKSLQILPNSVQLYSVVFISKLSVEIPNFIFLPNIILLCNWIIFTFIMLHSIDIKWL